MKKLLLSTAAMSVIAAAAICSGSVFADQDHGFDRDHDGDHRTATPIKHLVVIFNENVSFDHYFATYPKATNPPGEPAFPRAPRTPAVNNLATAHLLTNNPNFTNTANGADAAEPFRLDRTQANTADQNHAYTAEQQAYDGGKADLFPKYTGKGTPGGVGAFGTKGQVMGYFDGNTVTAMWHYAQHFAMSDNAYTDTYGPSTPGALEVVSGPDQRHADRRNHQAAVHARRGRPTTSTTARAASRMINDVDPGYDVCSAPTDQAMMTGKNIGDLLNAADITWGGFMGGFDLQRDQRQRHDRLQAQHAFDRRRRQRHRLHPAPQLVPVLRLDRQPERMRARARSRRSATASSRTARRADPANHEYDLHDFYAAVKAGNFPVGLLHQAAGLSGRPSPAIPIRSTSKPGRSQLINFLRAAAGLEEHGGDHHLGRFRRLVRPRVRASRRARRSMPSRPARRRRQMRQPARRSPGVDGKPVNGRCGPARACRSW